MSGRTSHVVLVADDHDGVRDLACFALTADGLTVLEARDGAEALALARQQPVEVVVLDLGLPEPDGAEVCRRLKADPTTAHVRILMVTGALDAVSQRRVAAAAPDAFMSKPFLPRQLVGAVRALLPS